MSFHGLLADISQQGIKLSLVDGNIRIQAPKGTLTEVLKQQLSNHKPALLSWLQQTHAASQEFRQVESNPAQRYAPFPLTDIQEAYWLGRRPEFELGQVSCHDYHEIEGTEIDLSRLTWAWQQLIDRHDMLRAIILPNGQQQILQDVPSYEFGLTDLRGQAETVIAAQLESIRERMSHQVHQSDQWPLFEIHAARLNGGRTRLFISLDFLIADGGSEAILFREWQQLYLDPTVQLPSLPLTYRDYVLAEGDIAETMSYKLAQEYWHNRLATLPPAPELPIISHSAQEPPKFRRWSIGLNREDWQSLQAKGRQEGLTSSSILLAAFAEVLQQWSKNSHFTINLTLFNRLPLHPEINTVVGDFTSLTLLEIDASQPRTFLERAEAVQQQLSADLEHRYYSGVRVIRELARRKGERSGVTMPVVFTSVLGYMQSSMFAELGDEVYSLSQTPQTWLDLSAMERDGALLLVCDAVEALFPAGLLDDMMNAYRHLLDALAADRATWNTHTHLTPAHQLDRQTQVNATEAPISGELLHTLFIDQVEQRAAEPAVITPNKSLTYQELYQRATHIGHWLRQQGAKPNTLVAVVMEKGWEQVVAVLGIHISGAAYLPIDPTLPTERLRYLLDQGEVTLALTQAAIESTLAWPHGITCLAVDTLVPDASLPPLDVIQRPTDLAYVIYTSGSTGLPKGVVIDHRGAVNTVLDINKRFGVTEEDRVLALSALNFDLSVYDIFGLLAAGGALVLPDPAKRLDPAHWLELLEQYDVTLWNTVPALMQMLIDYQDDVAHKDHVETVDVIMMSGDWIPTSLPARIKARYPHADIYSLGGVTEASIWSIYYPITAVDPTWTSIPYGKPLANQTFYVLDEQLNPRPDWVPGDLYIGGIGLALGYWKDEAKTAERFLIHPRTGERLYKTGDLGRFLPDGNIEFLGRNDFQVKVRGHRIELGEIEAMLLQHDGVKDAVVTAVGEAKDPNKQLVAYVIPKAPVTAAATPMMPDQYSTAPLAGVLTDPVERMEFKLRQPGIQPLNGVAHTSKFTGDLIDMPQPAASEALRRRYLARQSYRHFSADRIALEQLATLLGNLRQLSLESSPLPKYLYPSAGSLYPVQTYLYIKPDRIQEIAGGYYYYHPALHKLVRLSGTAQQPTLAFAGSNQAIFDQSAFALFLVGELDAILPMYGEFARDFCLLEAGYMSQLLMMAAPTEQLGLCPIGGLREDDVKEALHLGGSQLLLHCLLGGQIEPVQMTQWLESAPSTEQGAPKHAAAWSEELRAFLQTKLPSYMVPTLFMALETLPLSSNGKVDRKALPVPEFQNHPAEKARCAPRTPLEEQLLAIWQEVLRIEVTDVEDDFFDMGGDSLLATRLLAHLRKTFAIEISLRTIFANPTIAQLAGVIEAQSFRTVDATLLQAALAAVIEEN